MFYYRYYFSIIEKGIKKNIGINCNNQISAYSKAKRLYPLAEKIRLTRFEKLKTS